MDEEKNLNPEGQNDNEEIIVGEEDKKFDYSYVKELREEAKKYRTEKAELKREFEAVQSKLKEIEDAKLTEAEKDKKRIAELEKTLVDIQTEAKEKEIENLIVTAAVGKNFVDLEAIKMFALKELASEDEPDKKTIERILDKLAKDKPYLIKSSETTPGSGNFEKQDREIKRDANTILADYIRKGK